MSKSRTEINFLPALNLLWFAACCFSIIHVVLRGEPLYLLYALIISIFLAILIIFVLSIIRKKSDLAKGSKPLMITLGIYLILISWLGINKTYSEFREIVAFEKERAQLTYDLGLNKKGANWDIAKLYMNAPESVKRIDEHVGHKGTMMMLPILMEKIESGQGEKYSDDMYEMAEVAFLYGRKFSREWYEKSYNFGRKDAISRFRERMLKVNPKYTGDDLPKTDAGD